jgi:hypothetical protein
VEVRGGRIIFIAGQNVLDRNGEVEVPKDAVAQLLHRRMMYRSSSAQDAERG